MYAMPPAASEWNLSNAWRSGSDTANAYWFFSHGALLTEFPNHAGTQLMGNGEDEALRKKAYRTGYQGGPGPMLGSSDYP